MSESKARSFGRAFSEGLRVVTGKGGTHALEDSIPDTIKWANEIRRSKPAAAWQTGWQTTLASQEVDFIRFIDRDRILVGTIEPTNIMGHPKHDGVSLFHAKDGREIWRATREPFQDGAYALLATEPTILLYGSNESTGLFLILDPQTGEKLGQLRVDQPRGYYLLPERNACIVLSRSRKTLVVRSLDIALGNEQWQRPLQTKARFCEQCGTESHEGDKFCQSCGARVLDTTTNATTTDPCTAFLAGHAEALYVVTDRLIRINTDDGMPMWSISLPLGGSELPFAAPISTGILCFGQASLHFCSKHSGKRQWMLSLPNEKPQMCLEVSEKALVLTKPLDSTGRHTIRAIETRTGQVLWDYRSSQELQSPPRVSEDRMYFATATQLISLSVANGELLFKVSIPSSLHDTSVLPDVIRVLEDKVVVARECGVAVFSKSDGDKLYALPIGIDGENLTSNYMTRQMEEELRIAAEQGGNMAQALEDSSSFASCVTEGLQVFSENLSDSILSNMQQRVDRVFASTEWTLSNPDASGAERSLAHQERAVAIGGQIATTEVVHAMDRAMATASFVQSATTLITRGIEMTQQRDARMALLERCRMQVLASIQNHEQSTQNRYYIRPLLVWPQGRPESRGCAIVDLEAGGMTRVWTSPLNVTLFLYGMNLAPCAVSPSGDQIVTVGLGMAPSLYKPYVKHSTRMPYPSLLSFDPAKLDYVDMRAYEELCKGMGTDQESAEVGPDASGSVVRSGQDSATPCRKCGAGNPESAKFCHACGNSLAPPTVAEGPSLPSCRACGAENPKGFKFCKRCGAPAA